MGELFFLNPKTIETVIAINRLENPYGQMIARKTDTTYAHTCKILKKLKDEEIVECEDAGRKSICFLTEKGEQLAEHYEGIVEYSDIEIIKTNLNEMTYS